MSTFDEIRKQIEEERLKDNGQEPITVAGKDNTKLDKDGMPILTKPIQIGTPVGALGTETVLLDASTFQLMECDSAAKGRAKRRCCIVEKDKPAKYGNHFINSKGERVHVITREVFTILLGVLNAAGAQIASLKTEVEREKERTSLYKMTVDALKKNGVID